MHVIHCDLSARGCFGNSQKAITLWLIFHWGYRCGFEPHHQYPILLRVILAALNEYWTGDSIFGGGLGDPVE